MNLTQNHFELFDLPASFDIDTNELATRYRTLQQTVHPDRFAGASDQEKRLAAQKTAQINDAFQTLKHPVKRGQYLLEMQGAAVDLEAAGEMDPDFLFQQMELREMLEAVESQSEPLSALDKYLKTVGGHIDEVIAGLSAQLKANQLDAAGETVRRLQFFHRLQEEGLNLEEKLLD
ncbi:MAG: Fe-S protein assembly co-chaperone HscB [Pseudomonadota bacterium]